MAFYQIPFGHVEVHTDPRPQRPPRFVDGTVIRRKDRRAR
jgi:hypothetical protein